MIRRNIKWIVLILLVSIFTMTSLGFSAELPRVAVIGFDSTAPGYIWHIRSELSDAATDLMINALINTNRFRVFERIKLDDILKEQDFQAYSGRVEPRTAVEIGKMVGVDLIIAGSVTGITFQKAGGIKIGPVSLRKSLAAVTMSIRAIDVTTGEIIYSGVKKGATSKSGISIRLPVPGGLGISSQSVADVFSAIEDVCEQVAVELGVRISHWVITPAAYFLEGYVVKVESTSSGEITQVYINLGEDSGIKVGDEIKIFREGEVILDPKTNEVLDRELDLIARARIMQVKEKLSIALVTTKFTSAPIMPTDIVEVIK